MPTPANGQSDPSEGNDAGSPVQKAVAALAPDVMLSKLAAQVSNTDPRNPISGR